MCAVVSFIPQFDRHPFRVTTVAWRETPWRIPFHVIKVFV